tara:strand:- start:1728 stop:2648 length:921 start_codon:yes stop_codon:yes gene_type:complete
MIYSKLNYLKVKKKYLNFIKKQEVRGEPFYDKIDQLEKFYLPICRSIYKKTKKIKKNKAVIVGLSGGQGSGKTTIAQILNLILSNYFKLNSTSFSIDDYYKTLEERERMAKIHGRLFLTRGVPGTHDVKMLLKDIKRLRNNDYKTIKIPRFDKSKDDRLPYKYWKKIKSKQQVIIFEGWCVGAKPQSTKRLLKPINELEKKYDSNLRWRKKVNNELKKNYRKVFKNLDALIYLKVPSFNYVLKWRLLQEKKLRFKSKGKKLMNKNQIKNFIMYYERITKNMITDLEKAEIKINLDIKHRLKSIKFN